MKHQPFCYINKWRWRVFVYYINNFEDDIIYLVTYFSKIFWLQFSDSNPSHDDDAKGVLLISFDKALLLLLLLQSNFFKSLTLFASVTLVIPADLAMILWLYIVVIRGITIIFFNYNTAITPLFWSNGIPNKWQCKDMQIK